MVNYYLQIRIFAFYVCLCDHVELLNSGMNCDEVFIINFFFWDLYVHIVLTLNKDLVLSCHKKHAKQGQHTMISTLLFKVVSSLHVHRFNLIKIPLVNAIFFFIS